MIKLRCGGCGATLKIRDDRAGHRAKCPGCDFVFDVPVRRVVDEEPTLVEFAAADEEQEGGGSALDELVMATGADDGRGAPAPVPARRAGVGAPESAGPAGISAAARDALSEARRSRTASRELEALASAPQEVQTPAFPEAQQHTPGAEWAVPTAHAHGGGGAMSWLYGIAGCLLCGSGIGAVVLSVLYGQGLVKGVQIPLLRGDQGIILGGSAFVAGLLLLGIGRLLHCLRHVARSSRAPRVP